jgi:hypothetical protein
LGKYDTGVADYKGTRAGIDPFVTYSSENKSMKRPVFFNDHKHFKYIFIIEGSFSVLFVKAFIII